MGGLKSKPMQSVRWGEVEPPPVFRKLYRPLGAIVVTFADLEFQVTDALTTMLETSWKEGAAVEDLMQNFSLRIELFYFLAMSLTGPKSSLINGTKTVLKTAPELQKLAGEIYSALQQANSDRNNLLHGAWTGLAPGGGYSKDRAKAKEGKLTEIPVRNITVKLLKEEARFIVSVNMRVADWSARFRRREAPHLWPKPLPEKYRLRSPLGQLIRRHRNEARRIGFSHPGVTSWPPVAILGRHSWFQFCQPRWVGKWPGRSSGVGLPLN